MTVVMAAVDEMSLLYGGLEVPRPHYMLLHLVRHLNHMQYMGYVGLGHAAISTDIKVEKTCGAFT